MVFSSLLYEKKILRFNYAENGRALEKKNLLGLSLEGKLGKDGGREVK
jgi:hypothetical protein